MTENPEVELVLYAMKSRLKKVAFLDRDGTLMLDEGYSSDPSMITIIPGAPEALRELRRKGYLLVVITNQSGVGRAFFTEDKVRLMNSRMSELFAAEKVSFDGFFICPHRPDEGCECRKPRPGMLLEAAEKLEIDLGNSIMVGDKMSDVEAGLAAGCRLNILVGANSSKGKDSDKRVAFVEKISDVVGLI